MSYSAKLKDDEVDLAVDIKYRVCDLLGCRYEEIEDLEIIQYPRGGFFKNHYDHSKEIHRTHTVNIYLNEDYIGGKLVFPQRGLKFKQPIAGSCIWWENNETSLHSSKPLIEGEKWLLAVWVNKQHQEEIEEVEEEEPSE